MTFSPDGRVVVSIGREVALYVWNAQGGALIRRLPLNNRPKCVVLDRQNSHALCGLLNGKVGVIELKGRQKIREIGKLRRDLRSLPSTIWILWIRA
jgi:hypothetical protein